MITRTFGYPQVGILRFKLIRDRKKVIIRGVQTKKFIATISMPFLTTIMIGYVCQRTIISECLIFQMVNPQFFFKM